MIFHSLPYRYLASKVFVWYSLGMQYRFASASVLPSSTCEPVTGYAIAIEADDGTQQFMQRKSRGAWIVAMWGDEEVAQHVATNLPPQSGKLSVVPVSMPIGETADVIS
jgi:hypothetical protein